VDYVDNNTKDGDYVEIIDISMDSEEDIDNVSHHQEGQLHNNPISNYRHRSFAIKDLLNYDENSEGEESEINDENENDVYGRYYISIDSTTSECYIQTSVKLNANHGIKANSVSAFFEKLDYDAILPPLIELNHAIKAKQYIHSLQPSAYGEICSNMIYAFEDKGDEIETAIAIPKFWQSTLELEQYIIFQAVENRISRGLLMLSCSKAYSWVLNIANDAIEHPGEQTWYHRLANDISNQWTSAYTESTAYIIVVDSANYLPELIPSRQATVKMKRWTFNEKRQDRDKIQAITYVVEQWLDFPEQHHHKVRSALVSILMKHIPFSLLLLDHVWMMFRKPYHLVIHGNDSQRISNSHTEEVLLQFEEALVNHPLAKYGTPEHSLLTCLDQELENWFELVFTKKPVIRNLNMVSANSL
jgi:hypothetical protein